MTQVTNNENETFRLLTQLDPLAGTTPQAPSAQAKQELFASVIATPVPAAIDMPATGTLLAVPVDDVGTRRGSSALVGVMAATVALILVLGGLVLLRAPGAEAALTQAVERSAEFASGRAEIRVEILEITGVSGLDVNQGGVPALQFDYRFSGDDFSLETGVGDTVANHELSVGGQLFFRAGVGAQGLWRSAEPGRDSRQIWGLDAASTRPLEVLELVELADNYQVSTIDGIDTYTGTIRSADLLDRRDNLPLGLAVVTTGDDPANELPETMQLMVSVADGLLREIRLDVDGDIPGGEYVKAVISTVYSEFGEDQALILPSPEQITNEPQVVPGIVAMTPEVEAANQVMADLEARRPGLCRDFTPPVPGTSDTLEQVYTAVLECLVEAGEPEAAAAFRIVTGTGN